MTIHLSFSIGPVQEFVAQARRTRDLWAGSWLLSHLAEAALVAAEKNGGRAIIPYREKPQAMMSLGAPIGGMPNRFELEFTGDNAQEQAVAAAEAAVDGFNAEWQQIAARVLEKYVQPDAEQPDAAHGNGTSDIWQRQVGAFWELSWVIGSADDKTQTISHLAAMRKNFRNVRVPSEPGIKCSLMPTLQELSGFCGDHDQRTKQTEFWEALRGQITELNLGESERLSAIALIKRMVPSVVPELNQVGWPSTAFLAALPWLKRLDGAARQVAEEYQKLALTAGYDKNERQAAREAHVEWAIADGPIWFSNAIRNDEPGRDVPADKRDEREKTINDLLSELKKVYEVAGRKSQQESRPVPYYALLLMDGDSLGGMAIPPTEKAAALHHFAKSVSGIVTNHDGRTVYAGGDDVLVLLPAEHALNAASTLRDAYRTVFKQLSASAAATISAAVVYAHWKYPLRQVLQTAHHLLDDIAKDTTGRDSIAIGTILGSGLNAVWSVPWNVYDGTAVTRDGTTCAALPALLDRFDSREVDSSTDPPFNASYLYLLRERLGELLPNVRDVPGEFTPFEMADGSSATADLLRDLAHAEYRRRMKKDTRNTTDRSKTQNLIDDLMSLSRRWRRTKTDSGATEIECDKRTFAFDGWRVARFLKQIKDGKAADRD